MFCFRIRLQPWGAGEDELMVEYKGIRQAAREKAECKVKLWWPTPTSDRLGVLLSLAIVEAYLRSSAGDEAWT